jgi:hypothetical protein
MAFTAKTDGFSGGGVGFSVGFGPHMFEDKDADLETSNYLVNTYRPERRCLNHCY